jgi:PKD repeat protein
LHNQHFAFNGELREAGHLTQRHSDPYQPGYRARKVCELFLDWTYIMRKQLPNSARAGQHRQSSRTRSTNKRRRTAAVSRSTQAILERLEDRQLLSTSVTFSNGVLTLNGDPKLANNLTVELDPSGKSIGANAQGKLLSVGLSSVKQIVINGGSGKDRVYIANSISIPTTISTGDGNDIIKAGAGDATVNAGNGQDWIAVHGAHTSVKVGSGDSTVLGGIGDDTVVAGNGNDFLDGADANDFITSGDGNSTINGQSGNDTLVAGNGNDSINGGTGNDRLVSGTGITTFAPGIGTNYIVAGNPKDVIVKSSGTNTVVDAKGTLIADPTTSTPGAPAPKPTPTWTTTTAAASSDSSAPRAVLEMLAPVPVVGIGINVRATSSSVGTGSPITANYQWDFGDPGSQYNQLPGFNASHVYDNPGTYTIKLTVTNEAGKTSTVSQQLTIGADNRRVIYVDSSIGNDSNDGSSPSSAIRSLAKAASLVRDNTEVLFHRGLTFASTAAFLTPYTNVLIGAYGSGAKPLINQTSRINGSVLFSVQEFSVGITIQDLTLDMAIQANDPYNQQGLPDGVRPRGTDVTIDNLTFLHVQYAVNANSGVVGLTVKNSDSPNLQGIQGYFLWSQGRDTVVLNNTVANSIHEHNLRTSGADEALIADNNFTNNDGKGCIEIHDAAYAWIDGNSVTGGDIRVGPLGLWNEPLTSATDYAVIQGNHIENSLVNVFPGSHHIAIRDNIIHRDAPRLVDVRGSNPTGRQSSDILIVNNTGIDYATNGSFVYVENHTPGIVMDNNLFIAPHLVVNGGGTAGVYVNESDLSSFSEIRGNVWAVPASISLWAQSGINYVGSSYVQAGYRTAAEWNALAGVSTDFFSNTPINGSYAPSGSSLAANADTAVAGVFTDYYGNARPTSGKWTAGAVQV